MARTTSSAKLFQAPSFCPNQDCEHHHQNHDQNSRWFIKKGHFPTQVRGKVQRFQCKSCSTFCSSQTFHISYFSHSKLNYEHIDALQHSGIGVRQMCRLLGISIRVYMNSIHRIARSKLSLFDLVLADCTINENAAMDGFESFVVSQYSPTNVHLLVGSDSQFPYYMDLVVMNRKGRMTEHQKLNRDILQEHWIAPKKGIVNSCKILFKEVLPMLSKYTPDVPWVLYTDEKRQYVTAMKQVRRFNTKLTEKSIIHEQISSKLERTVHNPLFPVNYLDREIRTTSAGHVRETTRHDREVHMSECRMVMWMGHHGFFKSFRIEEKKGRNMKLTHAEVAGLLEIPGVKEAKRQVFTHRKVFSMRKSRLTWIKKIWQKETENPKHVNFLTKECNDKGQPGNGEIARHLVA